MSGNKIETNDTAYNQLYNNKNGVSLPLRVLVNEGLLSLEGTDLTEKDIENQYVVTFLGGTGSSENCEQITSTTSWGNDKEIYLCMNSNGSSNLAIIDPTKYSNKTNVSSEPYYFTGINPDNYANIEGSIMIKQSYSGKRSTTVEEKELTSLITTVRIYAIDRNDDILVAVKLNSGTNGYYCYYYSNDSSRNCRYDIDNIGILLKSTTSGTVQETWLMDTRTCYIQGTEFCSYYHFIFRLPSSCKITSGTGMNDNPFKISC